MHPPMLQKQTQQQQMSSDIRRIKTCVTAELPVSRTESTVLLSLFISESVSAFAPKLASAKTTQRTGKFKLRNMLVLDSKAACCALLQQQQSFASLLAAARMTKKILLILKGFF